MKYKAGQKFRTKLSFIWGLPLGSEIYAYEDSKDIGYARMYWQDGEITKIRKFNLDWLEIVKENK